MIPIPDLSSRMLRPFHSSQGEAFGYQYLGEVAKLIARMLLPYKNFGRSRWECDRLQTDTLKIADLGENRYPSEPIHAPDAINPEQGWVLTIVYDGNSETSEVWVFDSNAL